jgi:hypothetical protein
MWVDCLTIVCMLKLKFVSCYIYVLFIIINYSKCYFICKMNFCQSTFCKPVVAILVYILYIYFITHLFMYYFPSFNYTNVCCNSNIVLVISLILINPIQHAWDFTIWKLKAIPVT